MDLLNQTLNSFSIQIAEGGVSLNFDIFEANLINLTLLDGGLFYLLSGILSEGLSERQQKILGAIQESEEKLQEATTRLTEGETKLAQAQIVIESIQKDAQQTAAQVKSSIIFAALNTPGTTIIKEVNKSRNHSENRLKFIGAGIKVSKKKKYNLISIKGQTDFKAFKMRIPGDISSASFFIEISLLSKNSKITLKNVNLNPTRTGIIKILKLNSPLGTGNVVNTNNCEISVCETGLKNRLVIFSALDNLVKGASGQAVQNMNLIYNFSETLGLK